MGMVVSPVQEFPQGGANQLVVFDLDEQHYALRLSAVEQIVRVVEITPLPHAPESVVGVVNRGGQVVPVFHIRKRFRLPEREIGLSDHLIITHTAKRTAALVADRVTGVISRTSEEMTAMNEIVPDLKYVEGVVKQDDGLIFIHDLDTFLSVEEEQKLNQALASV